MAKRKAENEAKPSAKEKTVRPVRDKVAICNAVLEGMRSGMSTLRACKAAGVPQGTFNLWVDNDPKLAENYARARDELLELMASEIIELSDMEVPLTNDGKSDWQAIQQRKLQVDSRKWLLSKLAPRKYGERLSLAGDAENPVEVRQALDVSKLGTDVLAQIMAARDATD